MLFLHFCADPTDRRKCQSSIEGGLFQSLRLQQRRPKTKYAFVLLLLPLEISMLVELELRYSIISLLGTSLFVLFVWVYGLSRLFLYWMSMSMSISVCAGAGPMEGNLF